jgi:hypothetical protein
MQHRYPLHIHISTLFIVLMVLVGMSIAVIGYRLSTRMLEGAAADLAQRSSYETLTEINRLLAPAEMAVKVLSYDSLAMTNSLGMRMAQLELLRDVLNNSPALSAVYFGYASGDFFFLRRILNDAQRAALKAPPGTEYLLQSIERDAAGNSSGRGAWLYLGASLQVLRQDDRPDYAAGYDPRTRDWFKDATSSPGLIRTAPYQFFSDQKPA